MDFLRKNEIEGLILDVDNTLIDLKKQMSQEIFNWTQKMKKEGIKLIILSNTNKKEKVRQIAEKLQVDYFFFARKPSKSGFKKAARKLNLKNENIASIGDQIFTDVWGANRSKIYSILVKPLEEKDILITKIKRPLERLVINRYLNEQKKGR
ncbi:MAG: YqeG family HAD IIIA-type phosphatase [Clostridia bacterium]|nr:YqeG family HAD IIIA-type phosphatase [Clostridia bacterium]